MNYNQYLNELNKTTKVILSFLLVLGIGACDYAMDLASVGQISFSIFYLLPIGFATWYIERNTGIILSLSGALVWHAAGVFSGHFNYSSLLPYWNTAVRLGFFLIVVIILSRLKVELDNRTKLVLLLQSTLQEIKHAEDQLRQKADELARSNAELEHFAFIAAHDLRSPLVTIGGYIRMLRKDYKDVLDEEAMSMIAIALNGVSRMELLIQGLLSYARLGSNIKEFRLVNLNESFTWALSNLESFIEETEADVTCDALPSVMADNMQMVQLFQNLIGNALRYRSKTESPRIHLSVRKEQQELVFSLKDNGIGIDAEDFENIFALFKRAKKVGDDGGAGIGLSLCKKIVELHGGRIWVESECGRGTVFHFTLSSGLVDQTIPA